MQKSRTRSQLAFSRNLSTLLSRSTGGRDLCLRRVPRGAGPDVEHRSQPSPDEGGSVRAAPRETRTPAPPGRGQRSDDHEVATKPPATTAIVSRDEAPPRPNRGVSPRTLKQRGHGILTRRRIRAAPAGASTAGTNSPGLPLASRRWDGVLDGVRGAAGRHGAVPTASDTGVPAFLVDALRRTLRQSRRRRRGLRPFRRGRRCVRS